MLSVQRSQKHTFQGIRIAYKHHKETIDSIRSEPLMYRHDLFNNIHMDVKRCSRQSEQIQPKMCKKVQRLNHLIHDAMCDKINKGKSAFMFSIQKQSSTMIQRLASIQRYEHTYEQSAMKPMGFILLLKNQPLETIFQHLYHVHHIRLFMTDSVNSRDIIAKSMTDIKITAKERQIKYEQLFKPMPSLVLHNVFSVPRIKGCDHISCVTSDRVWIGNLGTDAIHMLYMFMFSSLQDKALSISQLKDDRKITESRLNGRAMSLSHLSRLFS